MEHNEKVQEVKINKESKSKIVNIIAVIIIAILFIIGAFFCFRAVLLKPENVYKNVVEELADTAFDILVSTDEKNDKIENIDIGLDVTLEVEDKELKEFLFVDLINKIDLKINTKLDAKTDQMVLNLYSTYEKEKLLDLSLYIDEENKKEYIYAKDYLDNFLEMNLENEIVNSDDEQKEIILVQKLNKEKAQKILREEFSNIITEDMCSKQDGTFVLKTTSRVLLKNIKDVLEGLKTNQEFLECFENKQNIISEINEILNSIPEIDQTKNYEIDIRIHVGLLFNIEKVSVQISEVDGSKVIDALILKNKKHISFVVNVDGNKLIDGNVKMKNVKENYNIDSIVNISDFGSINIKMDISSSEVEYIEKIDPTKVKKIEDVNMIEWINIMTKIENSKLGEVMNDIYKPFIPNISFQQ